MSRSRFGERLSGELVGAVRAGATLVEACEAAGVSRHTVKTWLRRGRREEGTEHAAFAADIDAARAGAAKRPMTPEELRELVWVAARRGSVQAMRLAWKFIEADRRAAVPVPPADSLTKCDELAARRTRSVINGQG